MEGQKVPVTPTAVPTAAPVTPPTALAAVAPTGTQLFDQEMLLRENAQLKLQVVELNEKVERMLKALEKIDFNALDEIAKAKRIELNKAQAAKEAGAKTEAAASSKASGSAATALADQIKNQQPQQPPT